MVLIKIEPAINEIIATAPSRMRLQQNKMILSRKLYGYNNVTNITIDTIIQNWHEVFHHLIVNNHSIDLIMAKTPKKSYISTLLMDSYYILNQTNNNEFYRSLSSSRYKYSFHDMIRLRRQIMIITQYFDYNTLRQFDYFIYDKIIDIFKDISGYYHDYRSIMKHQWFHIHISKAAGTTVRSTFNQIFNASHSTYLLSSVNLKCTEQYKYAPNKYIYKQLSQQNKTSSDSQDIEFIKNKYNHINITKYLYNYSIKLDAKPTYIQREDPLLTSNDYYDLYPNERNYNGPSLCNNFIYIMPFREPLERICSQSSQVNMHKKVLSTQNIWRRYNEWKLNRDKFAGDNITRDGHLDECYKDNILINGVPYRLMTDSIDYNGYFAYLLTSEDSHNSKDFKEIKSEQDVFERLILSAYDKEYDANKFILELPECFADREGIRWFPVNYTGNIVDSEFIISSNKYMVDVAWHRTKTGSNIYTSWLGYNYTKSNDDYVEFGNYVPRDKINQTHLMNAVDIMMQIDYVLPFQKSHDQLRNNNYGWSATLKDITEYYGYNMTNNIFWLNSNESGGKYKIKSSDICESMSVEDHAILLKYNQLDLKLYEISKMIEQIDYKFLAT